MELAENCLLLWGQGENQRKLRLLWVDPQDGRHFFIVAEGSRAWPFSRTQDEVQAAVQNDHVKVVEDDIQAALYHEKDLSESSKLLYEQAYQLIQGLVEDEEHKIFNPALCGQLIRKAAADHKKSRGTVYKSLRRYWQRGQRPISVQPNFPLCGARGSLYQDANAPQRRKRGRPRKVTPGVGVNLSKEDLANFKEFIEKLYLKRDQKPLRLVYEKMLTARYGLKELNIDDDVEVLAMQNKLPSLGQFRYVFMKNYGLVQCFKARKGELNYLRNHRPTLGDATKQARYPGALYQIDCTTADICLVSSNDPSLLIGRPILYLVVDTLTTLIAGLHVTFENPSYNVAALALWNAYCDKVKFCAELGITIKQEDWPSYGLPTSLLADRGELLSYASDGLIEKLGVNIAQTAPYRADAKPLVERMFQQLNQLTIRWLEGAKPKGEDPSLDDYRKLGRHSENSFMQDLVEGVLVYNKSIKERYWLDKEMIAAGLKQIRPVALWAWGRRNLTGMMKHMDEASVRVGLMPMKSGSVTQEGILFDHLLYRPPPCVEAEWLTRARNYGNWQIECSYDPNSVNYIFYSGKTARDFQTCRLTEKCRRGYEGWSWFEFHKWWDSHKLETNFGLFKDRVTRSESRGRTLQRHQAAKAAQAEPVPDGRKLDTKGIRENRENEKQQRRKDQGRKTQRLVELSRPETSPGGTAKEQIKLSKGDADFFNGVEQQLKELQTP